MNGLDFVWVKMDSFWCNNKSKELATQNPQEGFCRIHLQLMSPHYAEHHSQVTKIVILIAAFDSDVVDITFYRLSEMITKNYTHRSLISCSRVLQSERHHGIAIYPQRCSEWSMLLVVRIHLNLVVSWKAVHKRHPFEPRMCCQSWRRWWAVGIRL